MNTNGGSCTAFAFWDLAMIYVMQFLKITQSSLIDAVAGKRWMDDLGVHIYVPIVENDFTGFAWNIKKEGGISLLRQIK